MNLAATIASEHADDLRPFIDLFAKNQPPTCYRPYFPKADEWKTEFHERRFRADQQWATTAEAFLADVEKLSGDSRRVLEEVARLQAGASTDTPLLIRARELLSSRPSGVQGNIFEMPRAELSHLQTWVDFVLDIGIQQYLTIAAHSAELQKRLSPTNDDAKNPIYGR